MEYGRCKGCGRLRNLTKDYLRSVSIGCTRCGSTQWHWAGKRLTARDTALLCWWSIRELWTLNASEPLYKRWLVVPMGILSGLQAKREQPSA
jgi:hypothetical protein